MGLGLVTYFESGDCHFVPPDATFLRTLLKHPQLDVNDSSGLLHCAMKRTDSTSVDLAAFLLEQETLDINLRRWESHRRHFTLSFQKIMFLGVF